MRKFEWDVNIFLFARLPSGPSVTLVGMAAMTIVEAAMLAMEESPLTGVTAMAPMTAMGTAATVVGAGDVDTAAVVTIW